MSLADLQQELVHEVLNCLAAPWDRVEIHYEYVEWKGIPLESFTSDSFKGDVRNDLDLSFEAIALMRAMRKAKPEGQAENWSSFDFHLDSTGKYRFDHGYDLPPMAARKIRAQPGGK